MNPCRRCGQPIRNGRCDFCWTKDVKASSPSVSLPDGVVVESVHLTPLDLEGHPYPQPVTLARAIQMGLVLEAREGWGSTYYLLSTRVKLVLVKKEP